LIAGAPRIDGKRFVVQADEILTAFLEVEPVVWRGLNARKPIVAQTVTRLSRKNATIKGKFEPKPRLQLATRNSSAPGTSFTGLHRIR
jgi:hypothetical protein